MKNNYADRVNIYCNSKHIAVIEKHTTPGGKLVLVIHNLITDIVDAREYKTDRARNGAITRAVNRFFMVYQDAAQ